MPTTRKRAIGNVDVTTKQKALASSQKGTLVKRARLSSPEKQVTREPQPHEGHQNGIIREHPDMHDDSDPNSDSEDFYDDFDRRRLENIRLNAEFLHQFGILEAKKTLQSSQKKVQKPSQRGLQREKAVREILPRRSSMRLQNKDPEGVDLPPEALIRRAAYTPYIPEERPSVPAGPLPMTECLFGTTQMEDHSAIISLRDRLCAKPVTESNMSLDSYITSVRKTSLTEKRVAKVVPNRAFSVAIHPTPDKVLVAAGGKWGKLGLWDVMASSDVPSDGVCCYAPHSRPVTCLEFPQSQPEKIYSCSYDGTLRCGDLRREVFQEVYSIGDDDILLRNFSFTSTATMLVSRSDGCVSLVDTRTDSNKAEHTYQLHERSLRSVSVHPTQRQYFITGGLDGTVCLWDLRNLKSKKNTPLCKLPHGKSVNGAYFSPVSGKYILSTSMDDTLTIFDSSSLGSNIKPKKSISHNNYTGRWLTKFQATWHPAREDTFVVGSMTRPREITLYSDEGKKVHSLRSEDWLGSVCSQNAIHPSLPVVVGGNSSGRLHVFM